LTPLNLIASPELAVATQLSSEPSVDNADQKRDGVLQQWWFWTFVSAVSVGGAVTAISLVAGQPGPGSVLPGNTGLSIQV
jgi:hypothetical protein